MFSLSAQDWLQLALTPEVGPTRLPALARALASGAATSDEGLGAPAPMCLAEPASWPASKALCRVLEAGAARRSGEALARCMQWCREHDVELVALGEPDYPPLLGEIADPPPLLLIKGERSLLSRPQIAVVGSRRAGVQGRAFGRRLAGAFSARGFTVTSGLAVGVDAAAHVGALDGGGTTVAVLGSGHARVYPASNRPLARRVVADGAMISELPPAMPPARHTFPRRNRIISGLARGVVVVEAAERSGSLITARLAAEQGREVFAVPGLATDARVRGCHRLIQQGAMLLTEPDDVFEVLGGDAWPQPERAETPPATTPPSAPPGDPARVLAALEDGEADFDALTARTGLTTQALAAALTRLEIEGLACREQQRWQAIAS